LFSYASGTEPVVLGKPAQKFFQAALQQLDSSADQTVMIGDDIKSDIGGAQQAGLCTVLVRTGKFRPSDLDSDIHPEAVINSIADLPDWWGSLEK
jgi:ribonucleotide monophosphatase NagD (HAD superfamily)